MVVVLPHREDEMAGRLDGVEPGWKVPPELQGRELRRTSSLQGLERYAAQSLSD